jgi:hypothetical protein
VAAKAKARKGAHDKKVVSTPATTHGQDLVSRVSEQVTRAPHRAHPGHNVHRKGYSLGQDVKYLAHIYTPLANFRVNGSGILAIAAWSRRLESEGKQAERSESTGNDSYTRGLTHR